MTTATIGAVVRCGDLVAGVYPAVSSLLSGSMPPHAIAIIADRSTPHIADLWLSAFATARGLRFLRVDTTAPGGSWNAGLNAMAPVDFAICLEAGDSLAPSALESLARRLSSASTAAVATSGIEWIGPGTRRTVTQPAGGSASDILADTLGVHVSSLFRWSQWQSAGGFNEEMPALEYTDLWLRLLDKGGGVLVDTSPLLRRRIHARALYRRTWTTGDYRRAVQLLFDRHWEGVAAAPGALIERKERTAVDEHRRHEANQIRVREAAHEVDRLRARGAGLLAEIPAEWNSGVDLGALARTTPLAHDWGYERGTPADRPLIERYLAAHADDIRGVVLEIQEDDYTRRFGGDRVTRADVLDVDVDNSRATIIGDLRAIDHVHSETYDCIILTQTLHVIDDMRTVIRECERLLKPGGVLLATLPSASRVCLEYGPDADFWRVTAAGARRLFDDIFPASEVETTALGNPLVNAAFFFGLASDDLPDGAYDAHDPYFPMVVGVRARKMPREMEAPSIGRAKAGGPAVALMYHRIGARGLDPHRLCVSAPTFRAQLEWLCATCSVVPLDQLAAGSRSERPERAVGLTFDDGYLDNLTAALPLLRAAGVPATFFLTTGNGSFPYYYWWDRLAAMVAGAPSMAAPLTIDLPSGRRQLPMSSASEKLAAHWLVYDEIVRLPAGPREGILDQIATTAGTPDMDACDRRLTPPEVRELASDPHHTIGAHTVEHLFLPAQADSVLTSELVDSRAALEDMTGRRVDTLAYPFGAVDERTLTAARHAGFRVAVTCQDATIGRSPDPLALPRIEVIEESLDRFIARLERALTVPAT